MKRSLFLLVSLTGLIFWAASASAATTSSPLRFDAGLDLTYDDNVFQYSDTDLNNFDPTTARFAGLESKSDLIWTPSVGWEYLLDRASRVTLDLKARMYQRNTEKTYESVRLGYRLEPSRDLAFTARYLFIPSFFLRPLADPPNQSVTYSNAEFTLNSLRLGMEKDITPNGSLEFMGQLARKDYNAAFNERDSNVFTVGGEAKARIEGGNTLGVGYEFETADARGAGDAVILSDPSYNAHQWTIKARHAERGFPSVELRYARERRNFTTDLPGDLSHYGRKDNADVFNISSNLRVTAQLSLDAGYELTHRKSNKSGVTADFATYDENAITAGMRYRFN